MIGGWWLVTRDSWLVTGDWWLALYSAMACVKEAALMNWGLAPTMERIFMLVISDWWLVTGFVEFVGFIEFVVFGDGRRHGHRGMPISWAWGLGIVNLNSPLVMK
jgi:hypothetical protein